MYPLTNVCVEFVNHCVSYCFLQAVTAGYFYHTARLSKGGVYKTVKHQQVSCGWDHTTPCTVHITQFLYDYMYIDSSPLCLITSPLSRRCTSTLTAVCSRSSPSG